VADVVNGALVVDAAGARCNCGNTNGFCDFRTWQLSASLIPGRRTVLIYDVKSFLDQAIADGRF
jgi:hypothetical protein